MAGKIAKKNERVIVNRDFSIIVPEGYTYSTIKNEINDKKLVFIKREENEISKGICRYSLDVPFYAPQSLDIIDTNSLNHIDLTDVNVRTTMRTNAIDFFSMDGLSCETIKEENDILVYLSKSRRKLIETSFIVVTSDYYYIGNIRISDAPTKKFADHLAKEWLSSVQKYHITDADRRPRKPFVMPTYNAGKRAQIGKLTVLIPDEMIVLSDYLKKTDKKTDSIADINKMMDKYALLSITKDFEDGFLVSQEAPCSIECENDNVHSLWWLENKLWDTDDVNIEQTFMAAVECSLTFGNSGHYPMNYKKLGDKLAVVYLQDGHSNDPMEYWCTYKVFYFCEHDLITLKIYINAKEDRALFDKFVEDWILSAKPVSKEEKAQYEKIQITKALGVFAGKNGKIDGVKGTQMFFDDVFFFVKGQIQVNGRHHKLNGVQANTRYIFDYPEIETNFGVFVKELMELINYVEQDELLVLDEKCVHYAFDELNNVESPAENASNANLKETIIGKGLSGIRIFLFIAWHMIKIIEIEEDKYIVALDQNLYKGIPNAVAYVLQLIKRLREYNGVTTQFEVVFASTYILDGGIDDDIYDSNPLACSHMPVESVTVSCNENPYEVVQNKISLADNNGVWVAWSRGCSTCKKDYIEEDYVEEDYDEDTLSQDVLNIKLDDYAAKLTQTELKQYLKLKQRIKEIGEVEDAISFKGKNFVLTEVEELELMEAYIIQNGGAIRSSTVLETDYLIIGDKSYGDTRKAKRALELNKKRGKNIKAMLERDFWLMIADE